MIPKVGDQVEALVLRQWLRAKVIRVSNRTNEVLVELVEGYKAYKVGSQVQVKPYEVRN